MRIKSFDAFFLMAEYKKNKTDHVMDPSNTEKDFRSLWNCATNTP